MSQQKTWDFTAFLQALRIRLFTLRIRVTIPCSLNFARSRSHVYIYTNAQPLIALNFRINDALIFTGVVRAKTRQRSEKEYNLSLGPGRYIFAPMMIAKIICTQLKVEISEGDFQRQNYLSKSRFFFFQTDSCWIPSSSPSNWSVLSISFCCLPIYNVEHFSSISYLTSFSCRKIALRMNDFPNSIYTFA